MTVSRLGGGFGAKIDMSNIVTTMTALAAYKFNKPVRLVLNLTTNMTLIGWRDPFMFNYKVYNSYFKYCSILVLVVY